MANLIRDPYIAEKIVFVDGLTGTGKTMMGPLLGSFERVELGQFDHTFEYLFELNKLGKLSTDGAVSMLRMQSDLALYNLMIARETNFRYTDLSGAFTNPRTLTYLKRLFQQDGNVVVDRIKSEKPILHLISHQALGAMNVAFETFGERLRIIEMVRHPLYLLDHWFTYIDRFGTDARDFTLWIEHEGKALPWFAKGWENKYAAASSYDRVIYSVDHLAREADAQIERMSEKNRASVLCIPFEKFVLNPAPFLDGIANLLGSRATKTTHAILKKQNCPRKRVMDGPAKSIYKRYAWKKLASGVTDSEDFAEKYAKAKSKASPEAFKVLEALCKTYENRYGLWF